MNKQADKRRKIFSLALNSVCFEHSNLTYLWKPTSSVCTAKINYQNTSHVVDHMHCPLPCLLWHYHVHLLSTLHRVILLATVHVWGHNSAKQVVMHTSPWFCAASCTSLQRWISPLHHLCMSYIASSHITHRSLMSDVGLKHQVIYQFEE